jgi:pimeloyl-ACP methyl ester carboxylesterase
VAVHFISVLWLGALLSHVAAGPLAAQEPSVRDSTIRLNGIDQYFRIGGAGEPVVLLHGFRQTGDQWLEAATDLMRTHRVILPDLRGHGRSTNPTNTFTHRQVALDIYALLDALGIRECQAMGNSSGGMVLLHMATQQPARVTSMVLVASTTHFPEQARRIMDASIVENISAEQWREMRAQHPRGDDQIRALTEQFRAMKDSYDDMNFAPEQLRTITARTLVIHGDRDQYFPVEIPLAMYHSIPNSSLFIVPNGLHSILRNNARVPILPTALAFIKQGR